MPAHLRCTALVLLALASPAAFAAAPVAHDIRLDAGGAAEVKGRLKGASTVDYRLTAAAGQTLTLQLSAALGAQQVNVFAPGAHEAMFIGSTGGDRATLVLPADGAYRIQTYLMRSAVRRDETSAYTLKLRVGATALGALSGAADATVAGTRLHATAQVRCKPPYVTALTHCDAGVIRRGRDGTATVELRGPNDLLRQVLFVQGRPVASDTAQVLAHRREGDTTVLDLGNGNERYDIPDALLTGG